MRYTTKARMLDFNFLCDDVVYALEPTGVMLLAGMVTRADNLGRLPGEPSTLLHYLFDPKPPRSDTSIEGVEELLYALACAQPPVVWWYSVAGVRYIEFVRWQKHQAGLKAHNLKSTLPAHDSAGAVLLVEGGGQLAMEPEPVAPVAPVDPHALVRAVAGQMRMQRDLASFSEDEVFAWCRERTGLVDRKVVAFAHWLWNTGVRPMANVLLLLDDAHIRKPANLFGYYAVGSPARDVRIAQATAGRADAAHEAVKKEDERVFGRRS